MGQHRDAVRDLRGDVVGGDDERRRRPLDDLGPLGRGVARVEPGRHGVEAGQRAEGEDVVDAAGQRERDEIARLDAARGEPGGEFVGDPVGLGIGQLPARVHQRDAFAEAFGRLPQRAPEHAHVRNLQRRCSRRAAISVARAAASTRGTSAPTAAIELGQLDDAGLGLGGRRVQPGAAEA